jgi:hypothetical protein
MPLIEVRQIGINALTRSLKNDDFKLKLFTQRFQRENPLLFDTFSQFLEKIKPGQTDVAISTAHMIYMALSLQTEIDEEELEQELEKK